jgi:hypothetical protein
MNQIDELIEAGLNESQESTKERIEAIKIRIKEKKELLAYKKNQMSQKV